MTKPDLFLTYELMSCITQTDTWETVKAEDPAILEADVVVFSTPVYWYSIPAQIKCVIDRMFCFVIGGKDIAGKGYAVITCCEEDDDKVLDGVTMPLKRSADLIKWNLVGEVRVTGVLKVGDVDRTDGCKQAEALAEKI